MTGANHSQYLSITVLCQLVNLSLPSQFLCYCFSLLLFNLTLSSVTPSAFFTSTVSISATASVLMSPCGCRASLLLLPPKVPFILLYSALASIFVALHRCQGSFLLISFVLFCRYFFRSFTLIYISLIATLNEAKHKCVLATAVCFLVKKTTVTWLVRVKWSACFSSFSSLLSTFWLIQLINKLFLYSMTRQWVFSFLSCKRLKLA